nr:NADH dehydrogenase subunit 1 [Renocera pallida]
MGILLSIMSLLLLVICVFVSVAFLTLLERKVLGYIQLRSGPNKVGIMGIPQPFSDAVKLFTSEQVYPLMSNYLVYYISPIFSLFLSLVLWICSPMLLYSYSFNLGILFFMCCTSMGVYSVMVAGWSSNSMYALLGGLRAVAQTISYEVSLALILLCVLTLTESFSMLDLSSFQETVWFLFIFIPTGFIWMSISLAETNRTPFDFAEGESELVSGFNVEYSSGGFALIFLAEYSSILFMSMLFCVMFLGGDILNFMFYVKLSFMAFLFIWVRGTLPRFRYDKLMYLAWKCYLPFSLNFLLFMVGLSVLVQLFI